MAQATMVANEGGRGAAALSVAVWVLQVAAAAVFAMAGFGKLTGAPDMVALFDAVGVGQWLRFVTGSLEIAGALLLLVPVLCGVGALVLAGVMSGAILTHLFILHNSPAFPSVLLVVVLAIALARRDRTLRLLGR